MPYNIYSDKSLNKIRNSLKVLGYTKDFPKEVFGIALMTTFGMRKIKAIEWINNFEVAGKIVIKDGVVNFL